MKKDTLFIWMYWIEKLNKAWEVRVYNIKKEFDKFDHTISIVWYIRERRKELFNNFIRGKFKNIKKIYVEPTSWFSYPIDFLILAYLKFFNDAVIITYIRDAYPLFIKDNSIDLTIKNRLWFFLWKISLFIFKQLSYKLAFPSQWLADIVQFKKEKILLPPAVWNLWYKNITNKNKKQILYVWGASAKYWIWNLIKDFCLNRDWELIMICNKADLIASGLRLPLVWIQGNISGYKQELDKIIQELT